MLHGIDVLKEHLEHEKMECLECENMRKTLLKYFLHTWNECELEVDEESAGEFCIITDMLLLAIGQWSREAKETSACSTLRLGEIIFQYIGKKVDENKEFLAGLNLQ